MSKEECYSDTLIIRCLNTEGTDIVYIDTVITFLFLCLLCSFSSHLFFPSLFFERVGLLYVCAQEAEECLRMHLHGEFKVYIVGSGKLTSLCAA